MQQAGLPDLAQVRLDNALALFEEFVRATARHADAATLRGLERRFAERVQIQPSYWSQIKSRSRQIGERLARQFEQRCRKPIGWMDVRHGDGSPPAVMPLPDDEPPPTSSTPRDDDERFFTQISRQCDPEWLARLLADHTRYDHREAIEDGIDVPTLVMAGRRTACFPLEGVRETVRLIEKNKKNRPGLATWSVFDAGHWLFYEEPERFNREIVEFVRRCTST